MILTPQQALELAEKLCAKEIEENKNNTCFDETSAIRSTAYLILDNQEELLSRKLTKEMFVNEFASDEYMKDWQAQEDKKLFKGFEKFECDYEFKCGDIGVSFWTKSKGVSFHIADSTIADYSNNPIIFDFLYEIQKYNRTFVKPDRASCPNIKEFENEWQEYESKIIKLEMSNSYNELLTK